MARFMRLEVIQTILEGGLVPLFYHGEVSTAVEIVAACARGGARVVEFTARGERAYPVLTELVAHFAQADPSVILGVGSVVDAPTAALFLAAGANFIVGPSFNLEIAKLCNRRKVAYLPGAATETEIAAAEEAGAEIVKVFPGEAVGGPSFIKAVMAPCPWHRLLPTGGVDATEESLTAWLKAGAAAVGLGSKLITAEAVKAREYDSIAGKVGQCLGWIQKARGVPLFLGIEHPGLYPHSSATGDEIAGWYEKVFGLRKTEGRTSYFLSGQGAGRLEVDKAPRDARCHIAIRVSDFERAVAALHAQGIATGEPTVKPGVKAAYLCEPDPDGNLVHILWTSH